MEKKLIRTDLSSFEDLRLMDYLYVDKTEYVYNLVKADAISNFFFISRPRRYGKSLMCSTLKALFEGKRELFKGLYIDSTDYSFEKYPVLYFNFANSFVSDSYSEFISNFTQKLSIEAGKYGITLKEDAPATMLEEFLNIMNRKVVIIIDEYDAPIIHALGLDWADSMREAFNAFYATIKNNDKYIRFFFLTGVTKLSNLSIFSAMNNLLDISLEPDYAAMFGYTDNELEAYFAPYIDEYMERKDREYNTKEEFIAAIKQYYDGYLFSNRSDVHVLNPVSVGRFMCSDFYFDNYWGETSPGSRLAVDLAEEYNLQNIVRDKDLVIGKASLTSFDLADLRSHKLRDDQILALLFYTGYLTLEKKGRSSFYLTFPNTEVRTTFANDLCIRCNKVDISRYVDRAKDALDSHDLKTLFIVMNEYYRQHPYSLLSNENNFQLAFYSFFIMLGTVEARAEEETLLGRIDVVLTYKDDVYIIEMKLDGSAESAIKQIKDKRYYDRYESSGKAIHLVGLSFSKKDKKIAEWKEEDFAG